MTAVIEAIYRYPVKGLSPQPMPRVTLTKDGTLPADRLYAIENGPSGFDPAAPSYFPKQRFLMLMRNERLAALRTGYDEKSHTLTIEHEGREAARGDLRTKEGRLAIEAFFRRFMPNELRGPPKVLHGDNHSFSDVAKESGVDHQSRLGRRSRGRGGRAGRSTALSRQCLCQRLASLERVRTDRGKADASVTPASRSSSASRGAQQPTSTRRPGFAISPSRRH